VCVTCMYLCVCVEIFFPEKPRTSVFVDSLFISYYFYQPRSRGDNTFGSVRVSACVSVRLSVGALLFEPFDL